MRAAAFALLMLAACSGEPGGGEGNSSAPAPAARSTSGERPAPRLAALSGLYEGEGERPNQMCVVDRGEGPAEFGLVVWGSNLHSCSGSGTVTREGDTLRLAMAGDRECTIDAAISGTTITLPRDVPAGCAYYCGARATLGGASLTQRGTTEADAARAKDLVGDPLCTASEG